MAQSKIKKSTAKKNSRTHKKVKKSVNLIKKVKKISLMPASFEYFESFRTEVVGHLMQNEKRFEQIDERFAQIDAKFAQIDARFDQVDAKFAQIDARFDQVDAKFVQIDAKFAQIDARFDQIDAKFAQIDARFDQLDAKFTAKFDRVISLFEEQRAHIQVFLEALSANTQRLDNLEKRVDALDSKF